MPPQVTAGLGSLPGCLPAAHWAAGEALLRNLPLRLVHAWILLAPPAGAIPPKPERDQNYWARRIVDDTATELCRTHPGLRVGTDLRADETAPALLTAAEESELLVLGSRGPGTLGGALLGSVGRQVLARAARPVTLVRDDARHDGRGSGDGPADVVVGLALRRPCEELLEFAFDAAARRGGALRAVHALHRPPLEGRAQRVLAPSPAGRAREEGEAALDSALRPWREKFPGVRVVAEVTAEGAARAVVRAAAGTGLLLLGRHGPEPTAVPHIGPVAHAALHHAPCPVGVVPYR
ncbi:universal stress protein [Streptomyces sp. NPDC097640]|uniref:universal stress protein n=1 Tax=Streptomyces sp. NPDC097640 TaxID=3157229 RepID=UPI00331C3431